MIFEAIIKKNLASELKKTLVHFVSNKAIFSFAWMLQLKMYAIKKTLNTCMQCYITKQRLKFQIIVVSVYNYFEWKRHLLYNKCCKNLNVLPFMNDETQWPKFRKLPLLICCNLAYLPCNNLNPDVYKGHHLLMWAQFLFVIRNEHSFMSIEYCNTVPRTCVFYCVF